MRIDLPCCGFKNCKFQFDGNCTNRNEYDRCEFQEYKHDFYNAIEHLRETESCFGCKFAIDGAACLCEDCDIDEADCNEKCTWWGNPCGLCINESNWTFLGIRGDYTWM